MPLKVRVRAKIQLTFLDYLLQELVVVRGGVQVYHPSLLLFARLYDYSLYDFIIYT